MTAEELHDARSRVGLCFDCIHSRIVRSGRSSEFHYCSLSEKDPNFAKYPRLPVTMCDGHEKGVESAEP